MLQCLHIMKIVLKIVLTLQGGTYKRFNHGQECKSKLLKCIESSNQKKVHYPPKVYCYTPLIHYLKTILNRPGLCDLCEKWKTYPSQEGISSDVFDGKVWKKFNGEPFLLSKFAYGLMLVPTMQTYPVFCWSYVPDDYESTSRNTL